MKTVVIIPAYNEAATIRGVVQSVQKYCSNVVVIDDGSTDATRRIARDSGADVLGHMINRGQGAALETGLTYARGDRADCVVMFDADGQHSPQDIPNLIAPIEKNTADIVLGSRFLSKERLPIPLHKFVVRFLAFLHQWFFTGLRVNDSQCGLRALGPRAIQKLHISQDRMAHASEILEKIAELKLRYTEVPVHVRYTEYSLEKGQKNFTGSVRIFYDFFIGRFL